MMIIKENVHKEKEKNVEEDFAYQIDNIFGPANMTNLELESPEERIG